MRFPGFKLTGLIAATHTPSRPDGSLNLGAVAGQARYLAETGASGVFAAGTTGESHSHTVEERQALADRWAEVGREHGLKVTIHVGHNCLADAQAMAAHAEEVGADAISAMAPSYFRPPTVNELIEFLGAIADAAPQTPFYFYDIPSWTGVQFPVDAVLRGAAELIPTFVGMKFSNADLVGLQNAIRFGGGRYNILWGCDEALLAGLAMGCRGAVGSTYSFAASLYLRIIRAFEHGNLEEARQQQRLSVTMVETMAKYGFMAAAKSTMGMLGVECGPVRLPLKNLTPEQLTALRADLESIGFFNWSRPMASSPTAHTRPAGPHTTFNALTEPQQ